MAPSFKEIIDSGQFTFIIGEQKKAVIVHAAAIAASSAPMDRLINGRMGEAEMRCAEFPEVNVEDFYRFVEYTYRGDYTVPTFSIDDPPTYPAPDIAQSAIEHEERPVIEEPEDPPEEDVFPTPVHSFRSFRGRGGGGGGKHAQRISQVSWETPSPRAQLRKRLDTHDYLVQGDPKQQVLAGFLPQSNSDPHHSFHDVFLAHARIYTFANMHLIDSLKAIALHKLQKTLLAFKLYEERIKDIMALARYAYSDVQADRNHDGSVDDLRKLIVEYIACEHDTIGSSPEFRELIQEGGEFVGDFWAIAQTLIR